MLQIHIIAPYQSMVPIIKECLPFYEDLTISYSVGDLQKGVDIAKEQERKGTTIIISRGGTAQLIKENVTIPVIDIQLSGYDLTRSLTLASNIHNKTAVVGFSNITSGASSIIDLLNLPLNVFTVSRSDEVAPLLLKLKEEGYQQILGDVITIKTSQAYGLKGMLLQSGKESIIRSIEDALFLYENLKKQNRLSGVFEHFWVKTQPNILIFDEKNKLVYEHLRDIEQNLLTEEELYILNTALEVNRRKVIRDFERGSYHINVTGYLYEDEIKVYLLEKHTVDLSLENGVKVHNGVIKEPIANKSEQMESIIQTLKKLYSKQKPIVLAGAKGTGKKFLASYIHQELAVDGQLIELDIRQFDMKHINDLFQPNVRTIVIKNCEDPLLDPVYKLFLQKCDEEKVRLFLLTDALRTQEEIENLGLYQIIVPHLSERLEDLHELVLYFLADYHQKYGTTAVKVTEDTLSYLKGLKYTNHIDSLRNIIKQAALNEKDYMIHKTTIEALFETNTEKFNQPIQGTLKEIETKIILQVLKEEDNNQTKAAERLGINRATLWRKLKG
ncbi:PrpR N-terminal domain-containing protein [Alkalihalobacillus sp. 1P02AB]|uniref:PrpR N-terminal domain-containing protein n=1 Tax=Alkalihalobacillus sp. 1P02AB TaxID=3132260 RepID=UPI0039A4287D